MSIKTQKAAQEGIATAATTASDRGNNNSNIKHKCSKVILYCWFNFIYYLLTITITTATTSTLTSATTINVKATTIEATATTTKVARVKRE